jgi:hypothetical protein
MFRPASATARGHTRDHAAGLRAPRPDWAVNLADFEHLVPAGAKRCRRATRPMRRRRSRRSWRFAWPGVGGPAPRRSFGWLLDDLTNCATGRSRAAGRGRLGALRPRTLSSCRRWSASVAFRERPYARLICAKAKPESGVFAPRSMRDNCDLPRSRERRRSFPGSLQGGEMIYNWRSYDAVTANRPSPAYPANSESCSDRTVSAAHQPSSDLTFGLMCSDTLPNLTVIRPHP